MNKIKGKVIVKNDTIKVSEKFSKRTFVVKTEDKYPEEIIIELQQDKCGLLDSVLVGSNVEVSVNLKGRPWVNPKGESQWFNTVVAWKIDAMVKEMQSTSEKMSIADEVGDSLPF